MITKQRAKELSKMVWWHLTLFPWKGKSSLPEEIRDKVRGFTSYCALCSLFNEINCDGCPLAFGQTTNKQHTFCAKGKYYKWCEYNDEIWTLNRKGYIISVPKMILLLLKKQFIAFWIYRQICKWNIKEK